MPRREHRVGTPSRERRYKRFTYPNRYITQHTASFVPNQIRLVKFRYIPFIISMWPISRRHEYAPACPLLMIHPMAVTLSQSK